ncbi:PhzF family phenazine biosynthesis protein [Mesorhizobium australicum]|uniref:Trans-2,3-dihydro-3-hydroxyanthranilate isomerase n=1 Tax=Mesorhizobium australicum TaxID=536018 RepID=A0A1X7P735_9HYPH|nr:PhzF family phenazine biosynthesis protein [Mesorhizobium australicum]SMH46631.1 trans-2,3-dihydro-3-hydroxyanthranilate isomerase [Mesorhizobium australicum]
MAARRYLLLDVFAGTALEGNPLAVVLDAEGLDAARMQAITREFNLSETVFVLRPENAAHAARIRIFCPEYEMPFAGHPTVGTAVALWRERGHGDGEILVLEENIGPVRCIVSGGEGAAFAEFDVPQLSAALPFTPDPARIAAALGLDASDIGFDAHAPGAWSAGVPYVTVPVKGLDAIGRVRFDPHAWSAFAPAKGDNARASAYVYCRETALSGSSFHARMFVAASPSYEDPATGSAAAAFVGAVVANERPGDGSREIWIEQGMEMGRPSRIRLEIDVEGGKATAARIGGEAVIVGRGEIYV